MKEKKEITNYGVNEDPLFSRKLTDKTLRKQPDEADSFILMFKQLYSELNMDVKRKKKAWLVGILRSITAIIATIAAAYLLNYFLPPLSFSTKLKWVLIFIGLVTVALAGIHSWEEYIRGNLDAFTSYTIQTYYNFFFIAAAIAYTFIYHDSGMLLGFSVAIISIAILDASDELRETFTEGFVKGKQIAEEKGARRRWKK
jgi:K+-sensing histidine kinase KdpD